MVERGRKIMRKKCFGVLFGVMVGALLIGCATQQPQATFEAQDLNPKLETGRYIQKVDNFLVILDASGSMNKRYKEQCKLNLAKDIVSHMNQTIPDLKLTGALRTFGKARAYGAESALVYGVTEYTTAGLEEAVAGVMRAGGLSPLVLAMNAASEDLKSTEGDIALIVVSDGKEMDDAPVAAAKKMKCLYGDRLCIYTVLVGDSPEGKNLLEQVTEAGVCGSSVNADDIASGQNMAGFVEEVFLEKGVLDSDGDGVNDDLDQCPNTPRGFEVDAKGCPLDTDGDGVLDHADKCPNTPAGAKVNQYGCWVLEGITFSTGKWDIGPASYPILDAVVSVLEKNPTLKVEVQGHTDNVGSQEMNQALSQKRAEAVMNYFVQKGIEKDRLSAEGYGFSQPVASNETPEGRAQNRRVQLNPIY
jgi:OOP family OmpA-OmpF porin